LKLILLSILNFVVYLFQILGDSEPCVLYSLVDLERLVNQGKLNADSDPVLVVGAGLSAADAVIACRFHGLSVLHAFRRSPDDPNFVFKQLPENMYPEYHKVHQMMMDGGKGYKKYKALPGHKIVDISSDNKVLSIYLLYIQPSKSFIITF